MSDPTNVKTFLVDPVLYTWQKHEDEDVFYYFTRIVFDGSEYYYTGVGCRFLYAKDASIDEQVYRSALPCRTVRSRCYYSVGKLVLSEAAQRTVLDILSRFVTDTL